MRHIATIWNKNGITQGLSDIDLSEEDINEAFIKSEDYKHENFDTIYTSPLLRAVKTAEIMNQYHNAKIIKDSRLVHLDQGIFTGRKWSDLSEAEKELKKQRSPLCNMESWASIINRTKYFLEDIFKNHKDSDKILIITHGYNLICLEDIIKGKNINYNENFSLASEFNNCEIREYQIQLFN